MHSLMHSAENYNIRFNSVPIVTTGDLATILLAIASVYIHELPS